MPPSILRIILGIFLIAVTIGGVSSYFSAEDSHTYTLTAWTEEPEPLLVSSQGMQLDEIPPPEETPTPEITPERPVPGVCENGYLGYCVSECQHTCENCTSTCEENCKAEIESACITPEPTPEVNQTIEETPTPEETLTVVPTETPTPETTPEETPTPEETTTPVEETTTPTDELGGTS